MDNVNGVKQRPNYYYYIQPKTKRNQPTYIYIHILFTNYILINTDKQNALTKSYLNFIFIPRSANIYNFHKGRDLQFVVNIIIIIMKTTFNNYG